MTEQGSLWNRYQKKALRASAAVAMLSALLAVGFSVPAQAASPPSCVTKSSWSDFPWQYAKATNTCTTAKTFYFRWDRAVDGGCNTLPSNYYRTEGRAYTARFAGLTNC